MPYDTQAIYTISFPEPGEIASPLKLFTSSQVCPNLKQLHPFGCPVYVLQAPLQNRSKLPRWQECTRLGVYLGTFPLSCNKCRPHPQSNNWPSKPPIPLRLRRLLFDTSTRSTSHL